VPWNGSLRKSEFQAFLPSCSHGTAENPTGAVLHFVRRTGRAEMDEHAAPMNASASIVSINPKSQHDRNRLRAILKRSREALITASLCYIGLPNPTRLKRVGPICPKRRECS
jgi:hypothetical protein